MILDDIACLLNWLHRFYIPSYMTGYMTNYKMHYSILHDLLHGITWNYMALLEWKIAGRVQKECCWTNAWPSLSVCFACLVMQTPHRSNHCIPSWAQCSSLNWNPPLVHPTRILFPIQDKRQHSCWWPRANFLVNIGKVDWAPTRKQKPRPGRPRPTAVL